MLWFVRNGLYLILFSWALCDDHIPRATSPATFCHNLADFVQNSNYDIASARAEGSLAPAMSKFEFWKKIGQQNLVINFGTKWYKKEV